MSVLAALSSAGPYSFAQNQFIDVAAVNKADARAYRTLFRRVNTYKALTDNGRAENREMPYLKEGIVRRLGISYQDFEALERIAGECESELRPIQTQIQWTVGEFRKHYSKANRNPQDAVNASSKLSDLQAQEDAIILRYRDRFRNAIDEVVFQRVQDQVRMNFGITLSAAQTAESEAK